MIADQAFDKAFTVSLLLRRLGRLAWNFRTISTRLMRWIRSPAASSDKASCAARPRSDAPPDRSRSASPAPFTPARMHEQCTTVHAWLSGRSKLEEARNKSHWPDGQKVGRGFGQPYLQASGEVREVGVDRPEDRRGTPWRWLAGEGHCAQLLHQIQDSGSPDPRACRMRSHTRMQLQRW